MIWLTLLITACSSEKEYDSYNIEPISGVDRFADSIYFKKIYNIEWNNGHCYASDGSTIYVLNEELDLEHYFSSVGKGPKEYHNSRSFKVYQDNIHVFDNASRNVKTYTIEGDHIRNTKVTGIDVPMVVQEFDFYEEYLYMAGAKLMRFGFSESNGTETLKELDYKSFSSVFIVNEGENIVLVNHGSGIIQKLNGSGEIVSEVNLRLTKPGHDLLVHVDPGKPGVFMFIWDIDVVGNSLYALLAGYNESNERQCNQILKLDLTGDLTKYSVLKLPERRYTSFTVNDNFEQIIAYSDIDGVLQKFDINSY